LKVLIVRHIYPKVVNLITKVDGPLEFRIMGNPTRMFRFPQMRERWHTTTRCPNKWPPVLSNPSFMLWCHNLSFMLLCHNPSFMLWCHGISFTVMCYIWVLNNFTMFLIVDPFLTHLVVIGAFMGSPVCKSGPLFFSG
jgi:hypothetical protein